MTAGKTLTLTIWTLVSKVMSLLFNALSRFVIAFLPRSDRLLISWLQSPSAVIMEPKKRKSVTASTFSPSIYHEVMGPDAMIFSSVQSLSHVGLFEHARLPCPPPIPRACSNSCPSSWGCHPTISSSVVPLLLPSIFPSIRVFFSDSVLRIRWPNYWSFSFSISPSNEYSGLISLRIDWFDFRAVQGLSRVFSNTVVQKHRFFGTQLSLQSNSHIHT